jgi:uncharacterized protein with GYD domain
MLFCLTADYTPQALNAMRENPNTNRQAAVEQLLSAAGGKLVAMYGRATNGPGVMVIFDVTDPAMAPAISGVAVSAGTIHHVELTRLFTMDEVKGLRERASKILAPTNRRVSNKGAIGGGTLPPFLVGTATGIGGRLSCSMVKLPLMWG